jgi:hypothetical protein
MSNTQNLIRVEIMKLHPHNQAIVLKNSTCPYCGKILADDHFEKEHVVGRKFIPKGKLNGQWNLILNACIKCNKHKGTLEDDISAISLQPDIFGHYPHNDQTVVELAKHKAERSTSRRTNKKVKDSKEELNINGTLFSAVEIKFNLIGPAQVEQERLFELSRMHVMAFFYWNTFDNEAGIGCFWPGEFMTLDSAYRGDWGNLSITGFADAVVLWKTRVLANTAEGFFKLAIRRHPSEELWSWAVEYNYNIRAVGFFGDIEAGKRENLKLPRAKMNSMRQSESEYIASRIEIPLNEGHDNLFSDQAD